MLHEYNTDEKDILIDKSQGNKTSTSTTALIIKKWENRVLDGLKRNLKDRQECEESP